MTSAYALLLAVAWPLALGGWLITTLACRHACALLRSNSTTCYRSPPSIAIVWSRPWLAVIWLSAPLPALGVALLLPDTQLLLDWWLLGGDWRLDALRRALLGFSALLWALAGLYARGYLAATVQHALAGNSAAERRLLGLLLLWPLTLAGNLLLIVAEDIASFYSGFVLMTYAAYGLIVNAGSREAHRGGRAYLVMAVLGEGLMLAGLLWAAGSVGTLGLSELREGLAVAPQASLMVTLLWLGFGVKAGVAGLHMWLALAHPVAPTPASAVLSGAMIKAGLLGWWQTLPLGLAAFEALGTLVMAAGLFAAFAAALYGITQRHPKAVLAYSSISQMGMLTTLTGVALYEPAVWPVLAPALAGFVVHHGLNKGALFLGVGITEHPPRLPAWLLWLGLIVPALSLAGALASGLSVKWVVKAGLYDAGWHGLVTALSWAALGTSLLMARTLWCQAKVWRGIRRRGDRPAPLAMTLAWALCSLLAAGAPWWLALPAAPPGAVQAGELPPLGELPGLLWPVLAGTLIAVALIVVCHLKPHWQARFRRLERVPPGDLWAVCAYLAQRIRRHGRYTIALMGNAREALKACAGAQGRRWRIGLDALLSREALLRRWTLPLAGLCALLLAAVLSLSS